jgi:hypothetical protein
MRKSTKIGIIIATFLVILGCLLFAGVMSKLAWDFTKLGTVDYITNTYEISDEINSISIDTDTADILFAVSEDGTCKVECYEEEKALHVVTMLDGTLTVKLQDERSVSDYIGHIGINVGSPKITVYLPEEEYTFLRIQGSTCNVEVHNNFTFEDVEISTSTGDICLENVSVGSLDLSVSTGKITVSNVNCEGDANIKVSTGKTVVTHMECKNLITRGNTGDVSLENVIATEKFSIERSTGDVRFIGCDAEEICVKTDTGDVTGSLLSDKVFDVETDTGDVNVPETVSGGKCEIVTDTGDIKITIP